MKAIYNCFTFGNKRVMGSRNWSIDSYFCFTYSPQDIFGIVGQYWALEDEFFYPFSPRDPLSEEIVTIMHKEWKYRVNQTETLVNDLTHLGAPLPKRHTTLMHCNNKMELHQAINMTREENNRMEIRHNRYYMLCEVHRQAKEVNMEVDPIVIAEINSMPDCSSNIEVSDDEK